MNPAYRVPIGKFPLIDRFISQETATNTPITEMVVNSLITSAVAGQKVKAGQAVEVKGIAWDGGYGIQPSRSRPTAGAPGVRPSSARISAVIRSGRGATASRPAPASISSWPRRPTSMGATQTMELVFNPAGYHNNVVQKIEVTAA